MDEIEEWQAMMIEKLQDQDAKALEQMRDTFKTNSATMKENLASLKERFSKVCKAD